MTVIPLYDRVLLRRREAPTQTKSGLYVPTTATEKNMYCTVVAAGPGARIEPPQEWVWIKGTERYPVQVEAGDTVLIAKWAGDEVIVDEVPHLIVRESEILAIIREP